jgi:CBS domain-containing protein
MRQLVRSDFDEVQHVDLEVSLTTETVAQLGPTQPFCVEPATSVRETLCRLKELKAGSAMVCRAGVLLGIFTERDALRLMAQGANLDVPIETVMVRNPVTVRADDSIAAAVRKMSSGGYRRLPVVDTDGKLVGKISVPAIMHFLVEHFPTAVYNLPPQPQPAMTERHGA